MSNGLLYNCQANVSFMSQNGSEKRSHSQRAGEFLSILVMDGSLHIAY